MKSNNVDQALRVHSTVEVTRTRGGTGRHSTWGGLPSQTLPLLLNASAASSFVAFGFFHPAQEFIRMAEGDKPILSKFCNRPICN